MITTMAARIHALRDLTVDGLREKYREVFGEESRSRHKDFLFRKIAWRIQALEEGDLSERARRRAAELARDADARLGAPKDAGGGGDAARTHVRRLGRVRDARLPRPGTVIAREYRGKVLRVTVRDDGFEYEGRTYRTLSAIANEVTGSRWNGYLFFGLTTTRRAAAGGGR